jgi:membrane-bound metal-dependent hydrolase YbcI (DUF457 family)
LVLGHLTVTAAGRRLLAQRYRAASRLALAPLLVGAYLPDIVDKSAALLVPGVPGRGFGHSLVVALPLFGLLALWLPARRLTVATLGLGVGLHLLEDWVEPVVLFAPLLGPIPPRPPWSLLESLLHFYTRGGLQVWLEAAALLYWIVVGLGRLLRISRRSPALG